MSEAAGAVGFVVAGGRSRRMGRDKALLPWAGGTLLDHAIGRLRAVGADVRLLSGEEPRYLDRGLPVHTDTTPGAGPLGGLLAALNAAAPRAVLLLAVDMPFVTPELLRSLQDALAGHDAAVPVIGAAAEPLCAAYGAACREPVLAALGRGERRMTDFWPHVRVRTLAADDLARFGDPSRLFRNLNDPADYDAAVAYERLP
jgi:molybdopterin-guanine dinucleotide biosynthesis protein A